MDGQARPHGFSGRGGRWVVAQVALMLAVLTVGVLAPDWPASLRSACGIAGAIAAAVGLALAGAGVRHLGSSLTPFPAPAEGAELREGGVYGLARHPIYGGGMLVTLGWSLWSSPWAFAPTALLVILFEGKRRREEDWLLDRYPGYEAYKGRVPRRFIPYVV
ncbi:MAG: isoprenylcysteine carboxylmethyltransferase family protein [Actinomycetota bacterium]